MSGFGVVGFGNENSSASQSAYINDVFADVSLKPTNNTGFSSTVSTNPLQHSYANDDAPKYAAKTLWIKDLVPVSDRTLWVNSKPTYNIIWNEDFPSAQGYCFGAVTINKFAGGVRLDINGLSDGFGVGGIIRRVQWIIEGSNNSNAFATVTLDGAGVPTLDFASSFAWNGQPKFNAYTSSSSAATRNIHDYRLITLEPNTLQVTGVVVYYEVPGLGIDCFGGSTYLDKVKVTTSGTTLGLPAITNFRGGRAAIFKTAALQYGVTTTLVDDIASIGIGASGTNLLSVTTGTGASYPAGTIVYAAIGATQYIGNVLSRSTDTLTMGVTLPQGVSNALFHVEQAGHTFAINQTLSVKAFDFDVSSMTPIVGTPITSGVLAFQDPSLNYRVWGATLSIVPGTSIHSALSGSTLGVQIPANISSFLQIDGCFQSLEFEFMAGISGYIQATFGIDGMNCFNINEAVAGPSVVRKTMMVNAGPGWHSVNMQAGASIQQVAVTKITGYNSAITNGPSFGVLANLAFGQTFLQRSAYNATLMAFGNLTRYYADSIWLKGFSSWIRGTTSTVAGGVFYNGISGPLSNGRFGFYGSAIGFVGSIGTSFSCTVDGLSLAPNFGGLVGAAQLTNDFHLLSFNCNTGTTRLDAIDVIRPQGEVTSTQHYEPYTEIQVDNKSMTFDPQYGLMVKDSGVSEQKLANNAVSIAKMGDATRDSAYVFNGFITAVVAGNALIVSLKTKSGNDPSPTDPVEISFRSNLGPHTSTLPTQYVRRVVTAPLSTTVSSGSTLGHVSGQYEFVYVYAADMPNGVQLAVAGGASGLFVTNGVGPLSVDSCVSVFAEGGAGAADVRYRLYANTATSGINDVGVRYLGRVLSLQATAGTWASAPIDIMVNTNFYPKAVIHQSLLLGNTGHGSSSTKIRRFSTATNDGIFIGATQSATLGDAMVILGEGLYSVSYIDKITGAAGQVGISRNATGGDLTTNYFSLGTSVMVSGVESTTALNAQASAVLRLLPGDVIRAHDNGANDSADTRFRVTRIGE